MKKYSLIIALSFSSVLYAVFFVSVATPLTAAENKVSPYSQEEIVALAKPSVVRVVQHIKGTAVIPAVTVNIRDFSITVDPSRPSKTIPIDEYLSGSGFIVSSNGYIATNAHVVSAQTVKIETIASVVLPALYESALSLDKEESIRILEDEAQAFEFSKKSFEYVSGQSQFDLRQDIVVLNPTSEKESVTELMAEGFPVHVVSVNERFYADDKDTALIKIEQEQLPVLPLGDVDEIAVGKSVSIFGFPATAEFNQKSPLEATFTRGVISALKDSQEKDFKVFQTDAKVSVGSSGGPLLNEKGEAIGMITFQSNDFQRASGDNFAFAVPIHLVSDMIAQTGIVLDPGEYAEHLEQGLVFLHNRQCQQAIDRFNQAESGNTIFSEVRYVAPYKEQCQKLIDAGQSEDTWEKRFVSMLRSFSPLVVGALSLLAVSFLMVMFLVVWLAFQVRKEDGEIKILKKRLKKEENLLRKEHALIEKAIAKKQIEE